MVCVRLYICVSCLFGIFHFIMCNLQYHDRCRSFLVCTILHYWIYKYNWIFKSLSHYMFYLSKKVNSNWQRNSNTGQEYTCYTLETSICLFCPSVWIPSKKKVLKRTIFVSCNWDRFDSGWLSTKVIISSQLYNKFNKCLTAFLISFFMVWLWSWEVDMHVTLPCG